MYRQAQGLFRSMVGDSTLADVGRMLASWDGADAVAEPGAEFALPDVASDTDAASSGDGARPVDPADAARAGLNRALAALAGSSSARERWVFEQRLGEGGMGVVDRVWDRNLGREAARKTVVLPEGRDPHARLQLFLEEIRVISKLEHPAIVPIYEAGLDERGRVYFVMKLVHGRTLHDVLAELHGAEPRAGAERWTLNRVLAHLVNVSQALAYAHSKGVLHRDVKPANVMVGRYGETYLLDWGLARLVGDDDTPPRRRGWVGTPSYMAPERVTGPEQPEDPREDVYALGALLYHAIAGCAPFVDQLARRDTHELRALVEGGAPTPLGRLAPDAPEDLVALCEASMARERSRRPASAEEFAQALQKYLADVSEDRVEARRQAARAQRTFDFLLDMLREADPYVAQGRETTVREVLERAAREAGEQLRDEPEDAASMLTVLAEMLLTLGRPETAGPLLDKAAELLTALGPGGERALLEARCEQARCAGKLGRTEESEAIYRDVLAASKRLQGEDAEISLKALYGLVSLVRRDFGRLDEATRLSQELLARRRRVSGPEHAESLAAAVQLAWLLRTRGQLEEGEQVLQENVSLLLHRFGEMHPTVLLGIAELANFLDAAGQLERARTLYLQCADRFGQVVGFHGIGRCVSLANAGWIEHRLGDSDAAEQTLLQALEGMHGSGEVDPMAVLAAEQNLGLVQLDLGKLDAACERLAATVRTAEEGPVQLRSVVGRFRTNWARALLAAGRRGRAADELRVAIDELRSSVGEGHEWIEDAETWLTQASAPPSDAP